jgi:hypothetical protein
MFKKDFNLTTTDIIKKHFIFDLFRSHLSRTVELGRFEISQEFIKSNSKQK